MSLFIPTTISPTDDCNGLLTLPWLLFPDFSESFLIPQSDHSKIHMSSCDTCRRLQKLSYKVWISFLCTSTFCNMTVLPMPSKGGVSFSTSLDLGWLNNLSQTNRCQVKWQYQLLNIGLQGPSRPQRNASQAQEDESTWSPPYWGWTNHTWTNQCEQPLPAAWQRNKALTSPSSIKPADDYGSRRDSKQIQWRTPRWP